MNCLCRCEKADRATYLWSNQDSGFLSLGTIASSLGIPRENISDQLGGMGGGFGERAHSHHMTEAAFVSQKIQALLKMVYSR